MRFYLEMKLDNAEMELEYRKSMLSFIKKTLTECNNGKYKDVYFHNTDQKDYTFTVLLKGADFVGDKIFLGDNQIRIRFSTDGRGNSGLRLMNGFLRQKNRSFPLPNGNAMTLQNVREEKREIISNSKVLFRTAVGGGLCIREHDRENNKDRYYTFLDRDFLEQAKISLKNQALGAGFGERIADNFTIRPVQCKKVLVKHYGNFIDTTVGVFEIEGDTSLIQYFYDAGFGGRKSAGFGMVDLVTQDLE